MPMDGTAMQYRQTQSKLLDSLPDFPWLSMLGQSAMR